eukprot:448741-Rhodomonas_salina.2
MCAQCACASREQTPFVGVRVPILCALSSTSEISMCATIWRTSNTHTHMRCAQKKFVHIPGSGARNACAGTGGHGTRVPGYPGYPVFNTTSMQKLLLKCLTGTCDASL